MCHRVDRKIINSTQTANGKSMQMPSHRMQREKTNILHVLVQRMRVKLFKCRPNRDTIDAVTVSEQFNYRFDRNFEMRPNQNLHYEEKSQVRNWRYHLTNDHF